MRLAIFSSTINAKDGYGNITYELCMHHAANGLDITLFLPQSEQGLVEELALPFPVKCILPEYIFRLHQPKAVAYLRNIDVSGFDVVHSLFAFPYCIIAARSAKKHHKPFLMGAQGTYGVLPLTYFPERQVLKWCYRRAQRITVPSVFTKQLIEEYAKAQYPIDIIHNGVHFDRFAAEVDCSMLRKQYEGKQLLLTVGGLKERKGQDIVLRALAVAKQKCPNLFYIMVGEGKWRSGLEQLATELGVMDRIKFVGNKSGEELVRYFQGCDIYVHTPRVADLKFEGFGIVYLEASACGKPIVATDAGGIRDAVLDGETGLVAPDGDIQGVADRILTLCADKDLRKNLGDAGKKYAQKNDWPFVAGQFENLYRVVHV